MTTTQTTKINASTLAAFIRHNDAITSVDTAGKAQVEESRWQALAAVVGAYATLGADVAKLAKLANVKSGDALAKSFRDEESPVYVATDQRSELPSATRMSMALAISTQHSAERLAAYRAATDEAGNTNSARVQDYAVWLNIVVTGKTTSTKVDLAAMSITGKGANRKVGPLVRVASAQTSQGPATAGTVVGFFSDLLKASNDELAKVIADGPTDVDSIPMAKRRDLARQLMASVVLAEQSERITVKV